MAPSQPARLLRQSGSVPRTGVGLTIYGCEPDEAVLFEELCPRFGVAPTVTSDGPAEAGVVSVAGNRCVSVGHKSEISAAALRALREAGVEHLSTRSIGFDHIDRRAAEDLGICVENVIYAPDGVADYTLMLILMAIRDMTGIVSAAGRRDFRLSASRGKDLRDLTVGVVGAGHIGQAVMRRLHAIRVPRAGSQQQAGTDGTGRVRRSR